jgi:C-terminal peptidase (prc)
MDEETKKDIEKVANKGKDFKVQEVVILVLITCIFSFFAGVSFTRIENKKSDIDSETKMSDELKSFVKNYQYIIDNYYEELDEDELLGVALESMMELLEDPYSIYMNESDYNNLNITLEGSYKGLGISIYKNKADEEVIVSSVFKDSPAEKAGVKAGDIIVSANNIKTSTLTPTEFSQMILNSSEEEFVLVIKRDSKEKTLKVNKSGVVIQSVNSKVYNKNNKKVGYIYISIFANNTYVQFKKALEELEKQKIDSLIIDVRSNTGGHLTAVSKMISLFIDSKEIAYQLEQGDEKQVIYSTGDKTKEYPIVFLADRYSASASEVFIISLKDNLSAKLIGEKTYGKGTVQELVTLSSGDQYKITTKKWLSPKGTWINDTKGIEPDIQLTLSDKYYTNPSDENDNQLQRAIEELSK